MPADKKRLLFISQQLPYPLSDGGNIRTFKIIETLSKHFAVTLLASTRDPAEASSTDHPLRRICSQVICVPDSKSGSPLFYLRCLWHLLIKRKPPAIAYNFNPHILEGVKKLATATKFDAVHLNHADAAQYASWLSSDCFVLDTHNLLFEFHERAARFSKCWWEKPLHHIASRQMLRFELDACKRSRKVLVCSAEEKRSVGRFGFVDKVEVIPNGVDRDYFDPGSTDYYSNPPVAVFTGNMGYEPNHDGAVFFIRDILPILHRGEPEFQFVVVGKNPSPGLLSLARGSPGVTVTGAVDDVRVHMQHARVFVAPLRFGSGTRLKLLEAFSMGLPTVSTRLGAEGIETVDGEHLLLADHPQDFARQTLRLLRDRALHAKLSSASRDLARKRYDWRSIGQRLIEVYPV